MLRSRESNIRAFVKFSNFTERVIEIHWINFNGANVHYKTLESGQSCHVNTYTTHPWIFICQQTGERLCVNETGVFIAKPWFSFIKSDSENGLVSVERQQVNIQIPLKRLRETVLWKILFMLNSKDDVARLEIPKSLKADLLHLFYLSTRDAESPENLSE